MSTTLLYHGFGIRGYYYVNSSYKNGQILFRIKHDHWQLNCPDCKSRNFIKKGTVTRRFKTLPIGKKEVFIELPVQRIECLSCQKVKQVKLDFTKENCSYTNSFERYAIDLCRLLPISDVSRLLKVSWGTIKEIEKQKEFLNTMSTNIDAIEKNVKELMSIDRLNKNGFVEINEITVDACIDNAILTISPLAEQKQITIKSDYDKQRKKILTDAGLLNHALLNILDYAIRESHMGGIVEIKSYNEPDAFFISIKDLGKGISKLDIKKMMDDKSLDQYADEIEITKNIMKILNGDILIESNLGSGTIITLKFPHTTS